MEPGQSQKQHIDKIKFIHAKHKSHLQSPISQIQHTICEFPSKNHKYFCPKKWNVYIMNRVLSSQIGFVYL